MKTKTASKNTAATTITPRAARTSRNGVQKPKPNADDHIRQLVSAMNETEVRRFAATIEKHSKHNVVVLVFPSFEIEALGVAAEHANSGSVDEYIKDALHAAMENDLDSLRFDLRETKKGGAR